jgi:hypothetical protein
MKRLKVGLIPTTVLMTLFAVGTFYAQDHSEHAAATAKQPKAPSRSARDILFTHGHRRAVPWQRTDVQAQRSSEGAIYTSAQ